MYLVFEVFRERGFKEMLAVSYLFLQVYFVFEVFQTKVAHVCFCLTAYGGRFRYWAFGGGFGLSKRSPIPKSQKLGKGLKQKMEFKSPPLASRSETSAVCSVLIDVLKLTYQSFNEKKRQVLTHPNTPYDIDKVSLLVSLCSSLSFSPASSAFVSFSLLLSENSQLTTRDLSKERTCSSKDTDKYSPLLSLRLCCPFSSSPRLLFFGRIDVLSLLPSHVSSCPPGLTIHMLRPRASPCKQQAAAMRSLYSAEIQSTHGDASDR